jgi:hypothetical protein
MSALPPIADIDRHRFDVCFVPKADILPIIRSSRQRVAEDEKARQVRAPWQS